MGNGRQRVVVVTRRLDVGGTERHLLAVLPRLDRSRIEVRVLVLRAGGSLDAAMQSAGVPIVAPPLGWHGWGGLLLSAMRLLAMMAWQRRTIFHFFLPEAYAVGGICGLLTMHHRLVMSRRSLNLYQAAHPLVADLERCLHRRMAALVGNSRAVIRDLADEGAPSERVQLLYNGIDTKPFCVVARREATLAALKLSPTALVIVVVANLFPYKGHFDLLRALSIIQSRLPEEWHLLCVGRDEGIAPKLRQFAQDAGLGEHVHFLGERRNVPDFLHAADIGILCSHQEGFANSILEGMAAGLPMIVTDAGGNAEAVVDGETGRVVPPHEPKILGEAILDLVNSPETRRRMGAVGKRRISETFSLQACVGAYERLYCRIDKSR